MNRLELNDPRWAELHGGYRTPEHFAELLRDLSGAPTPELWDALHHQGDVDLGSYASLPYLLDAAENAEPEDRTDWILLSALILALRHTERNPEPPAWLREQLAESETRLLPLALSALTATDDLDEDTLAGLLGAVAVARGQAPLGRVLLDWQPEGICEACGETVTVAGYGA